MKMKYILSIATLIFITSCNVGKEGNINRNNSSNQSKFEVASSAYQSKVREAIPVSSEFSFYEVEPINNQVQHIGEIELPAETLHSEEQVFYAESFNQNEGEVLTASQIKSMMADELRLTASTTDNKFASRILNKTATKFENKEFQTNEKITFFGKLKEKVFGKIQSKYGISSRASGANILAVVSLVTGIVAFASYYGSFLLGLVAIITGAIALRKGTDRRGMAIVGIILGVLAILFWSGWIILY